MAKRLSKKHKSEIKQLEKIAAKLIRKRYALTVHLETASANARRKLEKVDARREKVLRKISALSGMTDTKRDTRKNAVIDRRLFANAPWDDLPLSLLFARQK